MQHRTIPGTDLQVSALSFGAWTIGDDWWGHLTDDDARDLIRCAWDHGMTLFDTSNTYGHGRSERLLGEHLADIPRDRLTIMTKFGYDLEVSHARAGHTERPHNWSPDYIRQSLTESLQRLRTDYVDFYLLHNPRMDAIEDDAIWRTLEDLVAEGKVRTYGVALGPRIGWREEGLRALETRPMGFMQTIYNLLEQEPARDFFPLAEQNEVGIGVRVPLSSGLLAGRYTRETTFGENDHRSHRAQEWLHEGLDKVDSLAWLAAERGESLAVAALRFVLSQPSIVTVTPTFRTTDEIEAYAAAGDGELLSPSQQSSLAAQYEANFGVPTAASAGMVS